MEEKEGTCAVSEATEDVAAEAVDCQASGECDVKFDVQEETKFATLLMLVPMLTLSAFNMMGLL